MKVYKIEFEQEVIRHRQRKQEEKYKINYVLTRVRDSEDEEYQKLNKGLWNDIIGIDYAYEILKRRESG